MGYRTVYDATGEIPGVGLPIAGLFVFAFCLLLWALRNQVFSGADSAAASARKRVLLYFLVGSFLFTFGTTIAAVQSYRDGPQRLAEGRALVVEGVVEGFQPMRTGHDTEHFTVRGVRFSYSNFIYGQGFNQTTWAGGPMREGLRVRIHYTLRPCGGGCADIQKLEIAE